MATPGQEKKDRAAERVQKLFRSEHRLGDVLDRDMLRDTRDYAPYRGSRALELDTQRALVNLATQTGGVTSTVQQLGFDARDVAAQRAQERQTNPLVQAALTPISAVLGAMDTAFARPIRKVAAAAYDIPQETTPRPETFHAALQKRTGPTPVAALPFEAVRQVGGAVGERVGGAIDLATRGLGAIDTALSGTDYTRTQEQRDASRAAARRTGETLGFDLVFDLSNLLGLGVPGSAAKGIAKSAAAAGKLDDAARAQLAFGLREAAQTMAIPERMAKVESAVQAATKANPKAAGAVSKEVKRLIGETGSRLDARPVTFAGIDVLPPSGRAAIDRALAQVVPSLSSEAFQRRGIETLGRNAGRAEFQRSTLANVEDMKRRIEAAPVLKNAQAVDDAVKAIMLPGTSQEAARYRASVFGPHAPPPGAMGPWPVMSERGQNALDAQRALTDLFQSYEPRIKALGVEPQPHKRSGLYYPSNVVGEGAQGLSDIDARVLEQILTATPGLMAKHGGNVPNLKKRASDVISRGDPVILKRGPAGTTSTPNPSFSVPVDLGGDLGQYADVIARGEGFERNMQELERLFGKPRGEFPAQTRAALGAQYPAYYEALQRTLDRARDDRHWLETAADTVATPIDVANRAWRFATLTANPAHHTKNVLGDMGLGIFGGNVNPLRYIEAATPAGKAKAANRYGVGETGFLQRSDLPGNEREKNILELQRAAGQPIPAVDRALESLGEFRNKLPTILPIGTTFGDWWEGVNKRALILDSMAKGLGEDQAALRALKLGIDYNAPLLGVGGRGARMAQANLWPFARYDIGSTGAFFSEFPGNLARTQMVPKALRAENQDKPNLAPTSVAQSGYALPIQNEVRDTVLARLPQLMGGPQLTPTTPFYLGVPQGQLDALGLTAELAHVADALTVGQPSEVGRFLLSRSSEPVKMVGSTFFNIDPRTLSRPPADLASPTEDLLGLAGLAVPSSIRYPANVFSSRMGGPDRLFGGMRDTDMLLYERALPFFTGQVGLPVMPASPQSRLSEILNTPEARELDEIKRALGRARSDDAWQRRQ